MIESFKEVKNKPTNQNQVVNFSDNSGVELLV